jgi:hypothetical protein
MERPVAAVPPSFGCRRRAVLRDRVGPRQDQRGLERRLCLHAALVFDRVSLEKFLGNKALVYLSPQVEWVEAKGDQGGQSHRRHGQ